jgi:formylglycine-generating enzyme required for sulfatase activity
MKRQWSLAIVILLVVSAACGPKGADKAPDKGAPAKEAAAPEKPAFTPGEMVLVPAGDFSYGENDKEKPSFPEQKMNLPAFYIDKYEVTNGEYLQYCIDASYVSEGNWRLFFAPDKVGYPVVNVTWNDAIAYCKGKGKRLPTEPEWEKAARGSDGRRYPWGEKWEVGRSNTYEAALRGPAAVNTYNDVGPYEIHDMLGNAQEWTADWFKPYKGNTKKDQNFGERFRVLRGARWDIYGSRFRLSDRSAALPKALYGYGFRCAKDAGADDATKKK